jgi:hypothetical protein
LKTPEIKEEKLIPCLQLILDKKEKTRLAWSLFFLACIIKKKREEQKKVEEVKGGIKKN